MRTVQNPKANGQMRNAQNLKAKWSNEKCTEPEGKVVK